MVGVFRCHRPLQTSRGGISRRSGYLITDESSFDCPRDERGRITEVPERMYDLCGSGTADAGDGRLRESFMRNRPVRAEGGLTQTTALLAASRGEPVQPVKGGIN